MAGPQADRRFERFALGDASRSNLPHPKPAVDDKWITVPADVGDVRVRIVKPVGTFGTLPVVLCVHGGGWVLGNAGTHDPRRVSRPAARAEGRPAAVVP